LAIISTSGLIIVAVLSGLLPALLDSKRAERERVASEQEKIREAAVKLLRNLANVRHRDNDGQQCAAGLPHFEQVAADLRGAYDAWALVVMSRLDASQRDRVTAIRENELGRDDLRDPKVQDLSRSTEIFELTWIASRNVR
jgi:hypothetical protein